MINYYLTLAWRGIRNQTGLSVLIAFTFGLGIAACVITFALIYLMSADPLPQKSQQVFKIQLDNWDPNEAAVQPNLPPEKSTWQDAINIVAAKQAKYQAAHGFTWGMVTPQEQTLTPFLALIRVSHGQFFDIFDVPFLYGSPWQNYPLNQAEYVVVLSKKTNDKLFAGQNSVGNALPMLGKLFTIVGVLDDWHPSPKFYDMDLGKFGPPEDLYIPLQLKADLELPHGGVSQCLDTNLEGDHAAFLSSECTNFELWVELSNVHDKPRYEQFLYDYVEQQKQLGRFPRPINNRMLNVMEWLFYKKIVSSDIYLFFWLANLFLLICVFNAASLISSKFNEQSNETALRRALGASQFNIFIQSMIETLFFGFLGGLIGLLLSFIGLEAIKVLYSDLSNFVTLDTTLFFFAIGLSVMASILAGIIPIWRVCLQPPAGYLK